MKTLTLIKLLLFILSTNAAISSADDCSSYTTEEFCNGEFGRKNNCSWRKEKVGAVGSSAAYATGACVQCDPLYTSSYLVGKTWNECLLESDITDKARCLNNNNYVDFVGYYCNNTGDVIQTDEATLIEDRAVTDNSDIDMERIESSSKIWAFNKTNISPSETYLLAVSGNFYLPIKSNGDDLVSVHIPLKSVTGAINGNDYSVSSSIEYVELSTLNTPGVSVGNYNDPTANRFYFESNLPSDPNSASGFDDLTRVSFSSLLGQIEISGTCIFNKTQNYSNCAK